MAPTLVILAAGMGSRYGGLKQLDIVGPLGHSLLEYSVYDALLAGFDRLVFVIRREMESACRDFISRRYSGRADCACVFQELNVLPPGFTPPRRRRI